MRGRSAACRLIDRLYGLICVSAFAFVRYAVKAPGPIFNPPGPVPEYRARVRACLPVRIAFGRYLKVHYAIHPPRCRAALLREYRYSFKLSGRRAKVIVRENATGLGQKKAKALARSLALP